MSNISIITLSDSDEASSSTELYKYNNGSPINEKYNDDVANDFPKVEFWYKSKNTEISAVQKEPSDLPDTKRILESKIINDNFKRIYESCSTMPDSCVSEENASEEILQTHKATVSKKDKIKLKEERLKHQQMLAREKILKQITSKKSKDIKPGECLKSMEVNLDQGIDTFDFHAKIKSILQNANIKFNISTELISNSITWRRNIEENYVDKNNKVYVKRYIQMEQQAIVIWSSYETVKHVTEGSFCASVLNIKTLIPDCNITLVIFGIEEYFTNCNKAKHKSKSSGNKRLISNNETNQQFEPLTVISRQQLEICLTEIQIVAKCSSRLIESADDMALMVYQYTKSISEIPYKLQKKENVDDRFDWYVTEDNKNTVRVDKDGNGLKRLWQQQLCQFNLSSLEIAEAICTVYHSPAQLIQAYRNCTFDEGIHLLKDIPIRRAAGPLTSLRKIGPELSKKIYVMFTSKHGDELLG